MAEAMRSEDQLGRKWDRCLSDTSIKIGDTSFIYALMKCIQL